MGGFIILDQWEKYGLLLLEMVLDLFNVLLPAMMFLKMYLV